MEILVEKAVQFQTIQLLGNLVIPPQYKQKMISEKMNKQCVLSQLDKNALRQYAVLVS